MTKQDIKKSMFLSFILSIILATTITTGDSYSKSTVINEVEGGNVYTRIEVEANGEKKILESSESGKHEVEVKSSGSSSSGVSVQSTISTTSQSTGAAQVSPDSSISTKIRNILDNVLKMISKIFRFGS